MSSPKEGYDEPDDVSPAGTSGPELAQDKSKKRPRKVARACDTCRRKKIRCDGSQLRNQPCSNCVAFQYHCTYIEMAKRRGPPKGYVERIQSRLGHMEKLIGQVYIDGSGTATPGDLGSQACPSSPTLANSAAGILAAPSVGDDESLESDAGLTWSDEEVESVPSTISETYYNSIAPPMRLRFFGKSSSALLIQRAINGKKEYTGALPVSAPAPGLPAPSDPPTWETGAKNMVMPKLTFPEEDLGRALIELYFTHWNAVYPLLHRPTFDRAFAARTHLRSSSFGTLYLLVCAAASRFSDDPRVLAEEASSDHSCGWKFFEQVELVRHTLLGPPCIEDLQACCLSAMFLLGSSSPQACWTILGIGIRMAQDVGAHRRKVYGIRLTVEAELWKRAFWILVCLDRRLSCSLGRVCAIHDEDFDLDLPVECDDEYWEHPDPEKAFKQPPDKPSIVSFFISFVKLNDILAFALRTIYSTNKSKVLLGFVGHQWERRVVAQLDSAMNKWLDNIPDHLRWNPNHENHTFFWQSCILYSSHYHVQITIYRPFIPSPSKPSALSYPSLAICTNAARSCSHVFDTYRQRTGGTLPLLQLQAFTAAIVLLLSIWSSKRSGLCTDPAKEMADVVKCMALLKACEKRWHTAGMLWKLLYDLASSPPPKHRSASPDQGGPEQDRVQELDDEVASLLNSIPTVPMLPHTVVGWHQAPLQHQQTGVEDPFALPVRSVDLGQLPLQREVEFTNTAPPNFPPRTTWHSHSSQTSRATPADEPVPEHSSSLDTPLQHHPANYPPDSADTWNGIFGYSADRLAPSPNNPAPAHYNDNFTMASGSFAAAESRLHQTTLQAWAEAPTGFGLNDWGNYLQHHGRRDDCP
ncbi:hypothetical protein BV22DRAFT_1116792 [Leucogyrophana mollusca]|uniref:Uncharacterized protein n=1 Tax=Leucogyrophana mollusca TaxID=85980 RepID=A0ACB8BVP7_9AGAM|nr:hypothetical protein BV22DRAFT_1116792 [Leucogyrophana mollusca]